MGYLSNREDDLRRAVIRFEHEISSRIREGKHEDAFDTLYDELCEYGAAMREASPVDAKCYSILIDLTLQYLRRDPNPKKMLLIGRMLEMDYKGFSTYATKLEEHMSEYEQSLINDTVVTCKVALLELVIKSPRHLLS